MEKRQGEGAHKDRGNRDRAPETEEKSKSSQKLVAWKQSSTLLDAEFSSGALQDHHLGSST
jgi:hypothetical protein